MTVEQVGKRAYTSEDAVWCVWFEKVGGKDVPKEHIFLPAVLKKVE